MTRPVSTISAAVLAMAVAQSCHTYAHVDTPEEAAARAGAGPLELIRTDHSILRVRQAAVVGDSLVAVTDDDAEKRVAVATKDIESLAVRQVSTGRSVALAGGVVLIGMATLLVLAVSLVFTQR